MPECPPLEPRPDRLLRGWRRWLLLMSGVALTGLATVGAFLPILPTTPFLLVAAACFVRSSPRLHRRLMDNRVFGPYLVQWQDDHTVPREAKRKGYGLLVLSFVVSIAVVDITWVRWTLVGLGLTLVALLASLPTTPRKPREEQA